MKEEISISRRRAIGDRLLRLREVLDVLPVSRTTWYDGMKIGLYPKSVSVGGRRVAWWESDVHSCIAELNKETPKVESAGHSKQGARKS